MYRLNTASRRKGGAACSPGDNGSTTRPIEAHTVRSKQYTTAECVPACANMLLAQIQDPTSLPRHKPYQWDKIVCSPYLELSISEARLAHRWIQCDNGRSLRRRHRDLRYHVHRLDSARAE